jgi:hypothetical protein
MSVHFLDPYASEDVWNYSIIKNTKMNCANDFVSRKHNKTDLLVPTNSDNEIRISGKKCFQLKMV